MSFSLDLTDDQAGLRDKAHTFAREVIRPVAAEYDRAQEFPLPVLEEAAPEADDAIADPDDLADEAEDIEVEVEDDKGEGDR